jgi:hypothetical protein
MAQSMAAMLSPRVAGLERIGALGEFRVRGAELTEPQRRPDDVDAGLDAARAVEHVGSRDRAPRRERERPTARVAMRPGPVAVCERLSTSTSWRAWRCA